MANAEHLGKLELVEVWNAYREANWELRPDLHEADLHERYLYGANLRKADLIGANLYRADLREADLRKADLCGADLRRAKPGCAKPEVKPSEADFYGANLCKANLYGADLREANLTGANLCGADLRKTDLPRLISQPPSLLDANSMMQISPGAGCMAPRSGIHPWRALLRGI
ncbi:MAG: pentapeptide repeat-containing protein [Bryobacteraceae bacterium]|jgi:uncharacterized protein YjbI with pentapeptide repeats